MKQPVLYGTSGGGGSWVQTIAVKAPSGASITVSGGGETLTGTGTGSYYAFSVHNQSTQYTINVSMPASVGGASAPAQTETTGTSSGVISFKEFKFATITTSVTQDYEGVAVTCVSGGTTLTITPAVGTSSITFRVPSTGNWVISGVVSGTTYYASPNPVVISSLDDTESASLMTRPNGKTVTPTDSIAKWLACGGVSESYTTLAEVLADHETLAILITDHNAVDYMVRSTTWISDVCSDATAMRYIGRRNYCADTLLGDSDWCEAICDSDYVESIINVTVPEATGASSDIIYSTQTTGGTNGYAWQAFSSAGYWTPQSTDTYGVAYVGYNFNSNKKVVAVGISSSYVSGVKIMGYDGSTWNELDSISMSGEAVIPYFVHKLQNNGIYSQYKVVLMSSGRTSPTTPNGCSYYRVQFFGREDVDETKIAIYGAVSDSDIYYLNSGTPVNVGSTNPSGFGEISRSDLPNGTYTLYSSVAKDPSNLSNDYSKSVVVDSNTIEILLMPDGAQYWYGWRGEAESCTTANGWVFSSSSSYTLNNPTYNTNSVSITPSSSNDMRALGSKKPHSFNKVRMIVDSYSGSNVRFAVNTSKDLATPAGDNITVESTGLVELTPSTKTNAYIFARAVNSGNNITVKAMWYE